MKVIISISIALAFFPAVSFGQAATTAILAGTVTDSSDARVPNATVTATNTNTNASWRVTASDTGEYRLVLLPPGIYDLKVEHQGFASQTAKRIVLTVGQTALADFRLTVSAGEQ